MEEAPLGVKAVWFSSGIFATKHTGALKYNLDPGVQRQCSLSSTIRCNKQDDHGIMNTVRIVRELSHLTHSN